MKTSPIIRRISARPWVEKVEHVAGLYGVVRVHLRQPFVFVNTGLAVAEYTLLAEAGKKTTRGLVRDQHIAYRAAKFTARGYLHVMASNATTWQLVGKFPSITAARKYVAAQYGLSLEN